MLTVIQIVYANRAQTMIDLFILFFFDLLNITKLAFQSIKYYE